MGNGVKMIHAMTTRASRPRSEAKKDQSKKIGRLANSHLPEGNQLFTGFFCSMQVRTVEAMTLEELGLGR